MKASLPPLVVMLISVCFMGACEHGIHGEPEFNFEIRTPSAYDRADVPVIRSQIFMPKLCLFSF